MSRNTPSVTTSRPHLLCTSCKSFWQRVTCLNFSTEELSQGGEDIPWMPEHVLHSQDRARIKSAALSGCHFCSIILGSIVGCTGNHGYRTLFNDDDHDPIYISFSILNKDSGTFLLTLFACEQSKIFSHDQVLNSSPSLRLCPSKSDAITTTPDELRVSSLQTSTFSKATAEFIKSWIAECKNDHPLCGPAQFDLLHASHQLERPKRLLDLQAFQDPARIQLIETEPNPHLEYCTLSYSWGFSKPYKTMKANLMELQREIHLKNLPKTIRDSIEVVRGLGFRFLWIDALCIVQDADYDEWFDQVGKLNDIFGNSIITIAASESFDGDTGFIKPRNPLNQTVCRLYHDTGLSYEVQPPCTPFCRLHTFDNARYHLDTRAWVFQERILSPRTAHFTRNFVHLECRTELKCETMAGADACHHSGAVPKADYQSLFLMLGLDVFDKPTTLELALPFFLTSWHGLLRRYSITNLTRPSDLLVALAGLAKQLQRVRQLTWSFGLWREYLLHDLLWYVRGGKATPSRERAPTWSWASLEVRGPQILYEACTSIDLDAKIIDLPEKSNFLPQPPLSEHESRYVVKIEGLLKAGAPNSKKSDADDPHSNRVHRNCYSITELHPECPFHPDYELPEQIELFSFLVARVSGKDRGLGNFLQSSDLELGLVLTPVSGSEGRYRRVGYFHRTLHVQPEIDSGVLQRQPSFFDKDTKRQVVEII